MNDPSPDPRDTTTGALEVEVTRSGGMAGIRRRWHTAADDDTRARWDALLARCPWEEAPAASGDAGADRFVWRITASCPGEPQPERAAVLPDAALVGPWLEVVRAVQDAAAVSGRTAGASSSGSATSADRSSRAIDRT